MRSGTPRQEPRIAASERVQRPRRPERRRRSGSPKTEQNVALVADGRVLAGDDSWPAAPDGRRRGRRGGRRRASSACRWTTSSRTGSRAPPPCRQRRPRHRRGPDTRRTSGTLERARPSDRAAGLHRSGRRDVSLRLDPAPRRHGRQPGRARVGGAAAVDQPSGVPSSLPSPRSGSPCSPPEPSPGLSGAAQRKRRRPPRRQTGGARATFAAAAMSADPEAVALVGEPSPPPTTRGAPAGDPPERDRGDGRGRRTSRAAARRSCGPVGRRRAAGR